MAEGPSSRGPGRSWCGWGAGSPRVPASWVRRPVAASRANTMRESAPAGDVDEAAVGRDRDGIGAGQRGALSQPGVGVVMTQPAMPASCTSDPLGCRAKLATAPGPAAGHVDVQAVGRDRDRGGALQRARRAAAVLRHRREAAGGEVELLSRPLCASTLNAVTVAGVAEAT